MFDFLMFAINIAYELVMQLIKPSMEARDQNKLSSINNIHRRPKEMPTTGVSEKRESWTLCQKEAQGTINSKQKNVSSIHQGPVPVLSKKYMPATYLSKN